MEKQRTWQLPLILAVMALTIYNVLPTIFFYLQPLKQPVSVEASENIAKSIECRSIEYENDAKTWIHSYCSLIQTKPLSISIEKENPQLVSISFAKSDEAQRFRTFFPRAGSLIHFPPAQLVLASQSSDAREVLIQRKLPFSLRKDWFCYMPKNDRRIVFDRMEQIASTLTGASDASVLIASLSQGKSSFPILENLAAQINEIADIFEGNNRLAARFAMQFTQGVFTNRTSAIQAVITAFDQARDSIRQEKGELANTQKTERLDLLKAKEESFLKAETYLKNHISWFSSGKDPLTSLQIHQALQSENRIDLSGYSALFSELSLDLQKEQIVLKYHADITAFRSDRKNKALFDQLLIDEAAKIARASNEDLSPGAEEITIPLNRLPNLTGYLVLDQKKLFESYGKQIQLSLSTQWRPKHPDLKNLSIVDSETYKSLLPDAQALCLVIASPLTTPTELPGCKPDALYIVAKGIDRIARTYDSFPNSEWAQTFNSDFRSLAEILYRDGFIGYPGTAIPLGLAQEGDFLFEKPHFSHSLLASTREDFVLRGTQKMALIELTDMEQRLLVQNKIETQIHEDLLKWRDDHHASQVSLDPYVHYDVPKPTKSILWSNFILSARKYVRGDERKIIRWGLDLSGGKTVQIELRDSKRQIVTSDQDLKQGINELYNRVNKMGVSEVSIRQVGHHIVLDFPGSQAMSASELIKASSMVFHVVNEKFSHSNPTLAESSNRFLQEVWNKASILGLKDSQSINAIAIQNLHAEDGQLRSNAAQTLWDNGLRLAAIEDSGASSTLDDSLSKIAVMRGSNYSDWHGQNHPLLIVFRNWALEGADLDHIRSGYDPSKGNFLSFDIAGTAARNALHSWTSRFSKEKILGTPLESFSSGRGWRMAAILNDSIISSPTLESALRDSAMISGSFSQREVNQLTADLKAGSLTFTPQILSEKNVSPELGKADRYKGIVATIAALFLVIICMVAYYRFAGLVASIAVLFNLLILWAILQNLGATLTLAGLAGVILTVGMAVDANVLVFERVKEEFAHSGRIGSALAAGYKKAYSAIIDSNVTTIIAALILLNFDAGPIKSFAINLIIGIASSMFTALFMTRFYFTRWAQNPKHTVLKMADWIRSTKFDFLKWAKVAFATAALIICIGCFLIGIQRSSVFGMDFTGGYALNIELEKEESASLVGQALLASGAASGDFQIRELTPSNHLRILFGTSLEQPGKPFYQMPIEVDGKNPRIEWVVTTLEKHGLFLSHATLSQLQSNWTAMSGQMSDSMRNNALFGLLLSFVSIFIYLAFRFEYKFATAALICLFHDVLITLGCVGLLHACGANVQIDLNIIAALMTIVGYSLNDTIIIFDRIREDIRLMQKKNLHEIVNHALNATLSRTTITSGTTLLVLVALVVLGGPSIFGFALVMSIGVFFGTLSSWFIASPLMIFLHKREEAKDERTPQLQ